jgi:ribonuclease R
MWKISIYISDVDHVVKEGSEIDKEALLRVESKYIAKFFRPMIPLNISTDICSLV